MVAATKESKEPKEVKVRVTRAFFLGGEPQKVGSVLTLLAALATELIGMNKATLEPEEAPKGSPADEPDEPDRNTHRGRRQ